jgi:hypothetical protein
LFWINEIDGSGDLVKQNVKPIRNNTEDNIETYEGHKFKIKYWGDKYIGEADFVVGNADSKLIVTYDWDISNFHIEFRSKVDDILDNIKASFKLCDIFRKTGKYYDCMVDAVAADINRLADGKATAEKYLAHTGNKLRNYTCMDETVPQSKAKSSYEVMIEDSTYELDILLDMPSSKVWYVDNFITEEECKILMDHGKPRLERATVADDDGSSMYSESRKAQQANYEHIEGYEANPLWSLAQRILAIVNGHMGLELTSAGQEPFTIIQYNVGDEYTPHCDGNCAGSKHLQGGRVATALMYCKVKAYLPRLPYLPLIRMISHV